MDFRTKLLLTAIAASAGTPAHAYELPPFRTSPGVLLGLSAAPAPAGIYGFSYASTYQGNFVGPLTDALGAKPKTQASTVGQGFTFVPGWTILGGTYSAMIVQPFNWMATASPLEFQAIGVSNTYVSPFGLNWMLGDSGFALGVNFAVYLPTGKTGGPAGLSSVGTPFWTFQPLVMLSYLKDDWNLTATIYSELNTKNPITDYKTGDILHAEFTATKTIGNWTLGPVAYYVGQISDDKSSAYYNYLIQNANRYDTWAVGGFVGYNFGPASVSLWVVQEVYTTVSGATNGGPIDLSATSRGLSAQVSLSYQLWAPDAPAATPKILYRK